VAVLPKIYAKCSDDQDHVARRRIDGALPGSGESEKDTAQQAAKGSNNTLAGN